ncbi:MAG: hypothetical protein ACI9N9_000326 [Enterobacterales bacterium]|jgi:hypothetical protein
MKLPKLYRVCWVKLYWLTDTCEGGEHVQLDGYYHLRARRVLNIDKSWFWQIDKWDAEQCKWELSMVDDLDPKDMFEDVVYKNPCTWSERDYLGYTYNRYTIKQRENQDYLESSIPF